MVLVSLTHSMARLIRKKPKNIFRNWHPKEQVKTLPCMGKLTDRLSVNIVKNKLLTQCIRGGMDRIVKCINKVKIEDVYDITVENEHHYVLGNGIISHNSGLKYAASTIVFLSKSKEKDGTEIVGNIIKCKTFKSRFTKENSVVETRLFYDKRGLDRYYGLLELGEKYGVFEKSGNRYKIGESSVYPKSILADPEKYFTEDVMKQLDIAANKEYSYGSFEEEEDLD